MSLFEERLLKIMELRTRSYSDEQIQDEIGLPIQMIQRYESSTKKSIEEAVADGVHSTEKIASRLGVSPVVVEMFVSQYQVNTQISRAKKVSVRKRLPIRKRIKDIAQALDDRLTSPEEIAERVGLAQRTMYQYFRVGLRWGDISSEYRALSLTPHKTRQKEEIKPKKGSIKGRRIEDIRKPYRNR